MHILAESVAEQVRLERRDCSLRISDKAMMALMRYPWPGNVDELRQVIHHAASLCTDSTIEVEDLPMHIFLPIDLSADGDIESAGVPSLDEMGSSYVSRVMKAVRGNKTLAAHLLGVDRGTLYRRLQRSETPPPSSEEPPPSQRK